MNEKMMAWGEAYAQWIKINKAYQEAQQETGYYPSELSRAVVEATIKTEDAWRALNNKRLCGNCRGVNQTVWWGVDTCPRCQRERVSLWGFPNDGPAPPECDDAELLAEWRDHDRARTAGRHPEQQHFNAWQFAPVRSGQ